MTQPPEAITELFCPKCDYNLRGLTSDRCPECGELIDLELAAMSRIPWEHRRRMGWFPALFRTAFRAIFQPAWYAREAHRPLRKVDALLFRNVCAGLSAALSALSLCILMAVAEHAQRGPTTQVWLWPVYGTLLAAGFALAILALSHFPTIFLFKPNIDDPRKMEERTLQLYTEKSRVESVCTYVASSTWLALPLAVTAIGTGALLGNLTMIWMVPFLYLLLVLIPTTCLLWLTASRVSAVSFFIIQPFMILFIFALSLGLAVEIMDMFRRHL